MAVLKAQYTVRGTVYDSANITPVPYVSVLTSNGNGTITDNKGKYEIKLNPKDSIWFSYLNKETRRFAFSEIKTPLSFDVSIQVSTPMLKGVTIKPKNYKVDSLQNRIDYAKIFNYKKPGISVVTTQPGQAAGFDLNELISVFQFKKNKSMARFQDRLEREEQEKYVDFRFSKRLVRLLTKITDSTEIATFMAVYRPPYWYVVNISEYDFQKYIIDSYQRYKNGLPPLLSRFNATEEFIRE